MDHMGRNMYSDGGIQVPPYEEVNFDLIREADLYQPTTYQRSDHLKNLLAGREVVERKDIAALFEVFLEGAWDCGVAPSLKDFAAWVAGTGDYEGTGGSEVLW